VAPAPSPEPPSAIVAVFDVEDGTGSLSAADAQQLGDYLSVRVASVPRTRVVPRDQLRGAISDAKAESYKACFDQSCQIELGKALSAEKSVATKLLRVGSRCAMTLAMFDLKTETAERAASTQTECAADALFGAVDDLVRQLGGAPASAAPKVATTLPVAPVPAIKAQTRSEAPPLELAIDESGNRKLTVPPPSPSPTPGPTNDLRTFSRGPQQILVLPRPVTFGFGHDELDAEAKRTLDAIANAIQRDAKMKSARLQVVGHADPSERGKNELSERRARNARTYLVGRGLTVARLGLVAASDTDPATTDASVLGRHRRIEIRLAIDD